LEALGASFGCRAIQQNTGSLCFEKDTTMTAVKQIQALPRVTGGKGAARATRLAGQVPAVIYGGGEAAEAIALDYKTTNKLIYAGHFLTTIFEIDVAGKKTRAIPRDYQLDPVRDFPIHVDFLRLAAGQLIRVNIPVHVTGQDVSVGVKRGGTINIVEHSISMMVPGEDIPEFIEVSVANLNIGQSVHIMDIKLPDGAKVTIKDNFTGVSIVAAPGMTEAEPAAATPAAAAAPAKGAAPAKATAPAKAPAKG
jgi:large subunit ribosomal protein L25